MARKHSDSVFADTSFFKALFDLKDNFHQDAEKIWQRIEEEKILVVTTNYVLDESFTLLRKRSGCDLVKKFRDDLAITKNVLIIRVTIFDEAGAWEWFLLDWSDLSFTDCVSFAVMKRLGIKRAAAFDQHFTRAGFKVEN